MISKLINGSKEGLDVVALASKHGIELPVDQVADWTKILQSIDENAKTVSEMSDYLPALDLERYPRTEGVTPDDASTGWALKVTARSTRPLTDRLKGRTVALKDNIGLARLPCTNGSAALPGWVPQFDATVATRIMDAGGVITGKSACENGCYESTSETAISGVVDNPWAKGYSAGGSSSGSASLVANNEVDMAIGCDQGGSIRMPAAFCGIVGLKPTWGLVPYTGIIGLDASIDHVGPMTRNVRDCALLLDCIAGADYLDDRQPYSIVHGQTLYAANLKASLSDQQFGSPLEGIRVGLLEEGFSLPWSDPYVDISVERAAQKFKELGATVEKCSIPSHANGQTIWGLATFMGSYVQAANSNMTGRKVVYMTDRISRGHCDQALYDASGPGARSMLLSGMHLYDSYGPALYAKCKNLLRKLSDEYDNSLQRFDVLITPTTPFAAPRHHQSEVGPSERLDKALPITFNTSPLDATGHPAISIPVGFVPAQDDPSIQLPVGMQIIGPKFGENLLFRVAGNWERFFDWKTRAELRKT